jgi:hypothetical protein
MWYGKGRFQNALTDQDPVNWVMNGDSEMTISLLTVRFHFSIFNWYLLLFFRILGLSLLCQLAYLQVFQAL